MPLNQEPKTKIDYSWAEPLKVFARLSVWIVVPVLIGVFLGRWLDRIKHSEPQWFLVCTGISFVVSMVMLVRETMKEYKKIDKQK